MTSAKGIKALVVVDVQNDFVPGGALPVAEGMQVVPVINRLQQLFELVVATQDWHPLDHGSFATNHKGRKPGDVIELDGLPQVLWPAHCIEETTGAAFVPGLHTARFARVFRKGTHPRIDSYSGFFDNGHRHSTGLGDYLRESKVQEVHVVGLATDYCVKFTAIDAVELGFRSHVILDACRGVELHPGDVARAVADMKAAGVVVLRSH
jgi:nicotinamidase/pyrazinamidase